MSLQLYQVDQKSFLLDFKSMSMPQDDFNTSSSLKNSTSSDEKMDIDTEEEGQCHQTLEFFEMCANLITALAR